MFGAIFSPNTLSLTELCLDCRASEPVVNETTECQTISEVLKS